jgi:hypothetical protein
MLNDITCKSDVCQVMGVDEKGTKKTPVPQIDM